MRLLGFSVLSCALAVAISGAPALADEAGEKAIKARKAAMQLYSWNLGMMGAMAKGAVPYDAAVAQSAANDLLALAKLNGAPFWPQGTDSTAMPGKTRTKLEAWTTWPEVGNKNKEFVAAAETLASVAGNGLEALQGGVGGVGKTCGGCHKPFREEE